MGKTKPILIEGYSEEELLALAKDPLIQDFVFQDEPVVFNAGTAEILARFKKKDDQLEITLSHIDGGGEGVLLQVLNLFRQFARENQFIKVTWIVHAVDCPKPNPKLGRILRLKGFEETQNAIDGPVYQKIETF